MGGNHSTDNSRLSDQQARNLYISFDGYKELRLAHPSLTLSLTHASLFLTHTLIHFSIRLLDTSIILSLIICDASR
jgi:hypothetical protein